MFSLFDTRSRKEIIILRRFEQRKVYVKSVRNYKTLTSQVRMQSHLPFETGCFLIKKFEIPHLPYFENKGLIQHICYITLE